MTRSTIRYGSRGDDVIAWQRILDVTRDGVFGVRTQTATEAWQRARGLHPDGIVGPKTWAMAEASPPVDEPPIALSAFRAAVVAHLRPLIGLAAPSSIYADAIIGNAYDRASPARSSTMMGMSCCALLVRAYWLALGIAHAVLVDRYRDRQAVADVARVARDAHALLSVTARPRVGDVVIVTGPEHVSTIVEWRGDVAVCIDGGQGRGGSAIGEVLRAWSPGWLGGRKISHIVDADRLALAWGVDASST